MTVKFNASKIVSEQIDELLMVGFIDDEDKPQEAFHLQYTLDEEAVYCERNDQRQGCYNGIELARLERTRLAVQLTSDGRDKLKCDGLDIGFQTDQVPFNQLQSALQRMLGKRLQ